MPTSTAIAEPGAVKANGFTLVELLVVLTILALAASAAALASRGDEGSAQQAAVRFAGRVAAARDEAVLRAQPIRVWVAPSGYGFEAWDRQGWQPLRDGALSQQDWGRGVTGTGEATGTQRIAFDVLGMPEAPATITVGTAERRVPVRISSSGEVSLS